MTGLAKKIKAGVGWSFIGQCHTLVVKFTLGIWLARILGPSVLGTVGMITIFTGIVSMLVDFGFTSALIQRRGVTQADYSTVFWFNFVCSLLLFIGFYLSSPLIAGFYEKPELSVLVKVLSFKFILSALTITQKVQLTKRIDFKALTIISIACSTASMSLALILAYHGFGVWALIGQYFTESILEVIFLKLKLSWTPSLIFKKSSLLSFFSFGMNVTAGTFVDYFSRNFDNLLVGKVLGDASLGIYSKAYALILFPISNLSNVIKRVLFPSFSLMQSNVDEIRLYYLRVTNFVAFLVFPLMGFIVLRAEMIVNILLGEQWLEMVPLLRVFGFLGMVQSILTLNGTIYLSRGRPYLALKVGLCSNFVIVCCVVTGLYQGGLLGVAYGLLAAQILCFYPVFITASRLIDLGMKELVANMYKILISLGLSMGSIFVMPAFSALPAIAEILLVFCVYALIYLIVSYILRVDALLFLIRAIKTKVYLFNPR